MNEPEILNELSVAFRRIHGDNAVEALVGALSSVTTTEQLQALLEKLNESTRTRI